MNTPKQALVPIVFGVLVLVVVSAGGGYWFARRAMAPMHAEPTPTAAAAPAAAQHGKPLYWYDPMQPNQHFDKPGKSPFMDMQLVPRYADDTAGAVGLRVSPNAVQNLGIRTGRVERMRLPTRLRALGAVAFDERLLELVQARVDGSIVELHVKAPFERVRRGEPLAEVLAPQWLEAEQQYLTLLNAESDSSRPLREAARERLLVLGVPEVAIRQMESARKAHATTTLYAPIDGVVTELPVRKGATFTAGASLFRVNGLKSVWVNAQIPEAQVSAARAGSSVEAHATAWPGVDFKGRVLALLPDVDRETRTLTARIAIDNLGYRLSPGMYVTLDFSTATGEPQLTVPSEAVIATGTRSVVIVAREDGGFDVANVMVGREQDGHTTILSGLQEGERIVLSGQFLIDSEASLTATVSRMEHSTARPGGHEASAQPESKP